MRVGDYDHIMVLPKNSKDAKGLREFMTTLKTQMCSASEAFGEPLKKIFTEVANKVDAVLSAIPTADIPGDWSIESQLESLFGVLTCASSIASQAALEVTKVKDQQATLAKQYASESLPAEIEKRLKAGDLFSKEAMDAARAKAVEGLVPQATVTQLCTEAKAAGVVEGEKRVRDEMAATETRVKLIATRKDGLQQASFPIPDAEFEAVLAGTDEEFTKAKTSVEARREKLKKAGIQLNAPELLSKLWLPEREYQLFEKTVMSIDALKVTAEPFASAGAGSSVPILAAL